MKCVASRSERAKIVSKEVVPFANITLSSFFSKVIVLSWPPLKSSLNFLGVEGVEELAEPVVTAAVVDVAAVVVSELSTTLSSSLSLSGAVTMKSLIYSSVSSSVGSTGVYVSTSSCFSVTVILLALSIFTL